MSSGHAARNAAGTPPADKLGPGTGPIGPDTDS